MKNDLNADGTGGDYRKILPYPLGNGGEYGPINVAVKLDVTDGSLSDSISTSIPVTKPLKADFGCTITLAQQAQSSLMQQSSSFSATIVFEDKSKVLVKGVSPITNFSIKIGNAMPLTGKISDLSSIKAKIGALNNNITYEVSNVDNFRDRAEKNMDKCEILQEAQKEVTSETQNIYANFDLITSGRGNNNTTYAMFHDISTSTPEGIIELISWDAGSLTNQIKINQTDKGDYSTMEFPFKAGTDKPYDVDITLTVKSGDIEKTVSKKFNVTGSGLTEVTAQAYKKSKGFGKYLQASVVDASTTQVLGDYVIAEPGATVYFAAGCIAEDASLKIRAMENNQEAQSIVDGANESDTAMLLINANKTNNANKLCTKPTEVEKIVKVEVPTEVIVERVVEKPKEIIAQGTLKPLSCFYIRPYEAYKDVNNNKAIDQLSKINIVDGEGYLDSIVHGYASEDGVGRVFLPNREITRAEGWKVIARSSCLFDWIKDKQNLLVNEGAYRFKDLQSDFWGYNEIDVLSKLGAIAGYTNGDIGPNNQITRAEFVKSLLWVFLAQNPDKDCSSKTIANVPQFSDIGQNLDEQWYATWGPCAKAHKIWLGGEGNVARPNDPITREEAMVIIYNFILASPNA